MRNDSQVCWRVAARQILSGAALFVLAGALFWASQADAKQYVGSKAGKWNARIQVKDNHIKRYRIGVPLTDRDGKESWLRVQRGVQGTSLANIRIWPNGTFHFTEKASSRWKTWMILKGRVTAKRIVGYLKWYDDGGDYMPASWTGKGRKPQWVRFVASSGR